jgi:hypothetical protein
MENISPHITYAEATKSQTAVRLGIKNEPGEKALAAMRLVALNCFEPIREHFAVPLVVSSFYRSPRLNGEVPGSAKASQHTLGEAIDIDGGELNAAIFEFIRLHVPFDQLIWEFGDDRNPAWCHVSYRLNRLRGSILRARLVKKKPVYEPWEGL